VTGGAIESLLARLSDVVSGRKRLVATAWLVLVVVAAPLSARQVERGDLYDFTTDLRDEVISEAGGASTLVVRHGAMWSNFQRVAREQLAMSELIGIPFIVAILLAAFGTLLATAMPIGIAVASVIVAGAATFLLAGPFEISIYVTSMGARAT
jgi:MMPL family